MQRDTMTGRRYPVDRYPVDWGHVALIAFMAAATAAYLWDTVAASGSVLNLVLVPGVAIVTIALLAVILVGTLQGREKPVAEDAEPGEDLAPPWHIVAYLALLAAYVGLLEVLGFDLATFVFVVAALLLKGERRLVMLGGYGAGFAVLCTWAFKFMIPYPMPTLLPYP